MSAEQTTQPEPPDGELVGAHLHGRPDAFTILYRTYQPRLVGWLARRTNDRAAAEDLAHDTLTRALSGLDNFDRDKPLWPWLRAIATNLATDQHRAAATQLPTVSHDNAIRDAQRATTDDNADLLAERDLLTHALHTLPDRQRVAMTLRYLHDWAPADIGRLMDLTRVSTEQLLLRARRRLCREYQKLTREDHYGWAWPLLLPYHALRDRLARLRDSLASTAPGPATATTEALATTAAIGMLAVITAAISLAGGLPSASAALTATSSPAVSHVQGLSASPVTGASSTGPSSRQMTPGATAPAVPAARPGTAEATMGTVTITPRTPATEHNAAVQVRIRVERDDDQARIIVEGRHRDPITGEESMGQGRTEMHCGDESVSRTRCDAIEGAPDLAPAVDMPG
jgi:RNA polymerase sigma-70 factor, ECF subfamily